MAKLRTISIVGDVAIIPLTQGLHAVIDAADAPLVAGRNWCAMKGRNVWYAVSNSTTKGGSKARLIYLHCEILGAKHIDHRDGDGLNCRRDNLRKATHSQNGANRGKQSNNTSGFKGVARARGRLWVAHITVGGKQKTLGYSRHADQAAEIYRVAAQDAFGEFART